MSKHLSKRVRLRRRYLRRGAWRFIFTSKCRICGQHSTIWRTLKRWPTGDYRRFVHPHCQSEAVTNEHS